MSLGREGSKSIGSGCGSLSGSTVSFSRFNVGSKEAQVKITVLIQAHELEDFLNGIPVRIRTPNDFDSIGIEVDHKAIKVVEDPHENTRRLVQLVLG
jgi:hypothetical protein